MKKHVNKAKKSRKSSESDLLDDCGGGRVSDGFVGYLATWLVGESGF